MWTEAGGDVVTLRTSKEPSFHGGVFLASAELGVALVTPRAPPWHMSLGPGPSTSGARGWGQRVRRAEQTQGWGGLPGSRWSVGRTGSSEAVCGWLQVPWVPGAQDLIVQADVVSPSILEPASLRTGWYCCCMGEGELFP